MNQDNGGIIGKLNTPTTTVASGVWTLQDQFEAQTSSIWPLAFPQTTFTNSCRFDDGSSDNLTRTPSGAGNRRTLTFSTWFKRSSNLGANQVLFSTSEGSSTINGDCIRVNDSDKLDIFYYDGSSMDYRYTSNQVLKDVSAWYHVCVAIDTTQGTASNRVKVYLNGNEITSFATETDPSQNFDTQFNNTQVHSVSRRGTSGSEYFDGYMAEVVMIDGQQLLPTSFGAFNPVTNIWEPIAYAGTYGTNGFRLDFADSSALGNDVSGNDNDYTANNLTSIDQSTDTCSNNFATWNPLDNFYFQANYFQDGNLHVRTDGSSYTYLPATFGVSSGKWYWEVEYDAQQVDSYSLIGITSTQSTATTQELGHNAHDWGYYSASGQYINSDTRTGYGNSYAVGDIIGVALDLDNNKLYFSKNGTFQNSGDPASGSTGTGAISITAPSSTPLGNYFPAICFFDATGKGTFKANFGSPMESISSGNSDANGHGNFEYAVPSGYFSLCTKNLAEFG